MITKLPELAKDTDSINQIIQYIEKHGTSDNIAAPNLAEYLYKLTAKLNEVIDAINSTPSR